MMPPATSRRKQTLSRRRAQGRNIASGRGYAAELSAAQEAVAVWTSLRGADATRTLAEAWADPAVQAALPQHALQYFSQAAEQVS